MTGKEIKEKKAHIEALLASAQAEQARELTTFLIQDLFRERKFPQVVDVFFSCPVDPPEACYSFELAYALSETGYIEEAEVIYEYLLQFDANNPSILNNLSQIKETKGLIHEAFALIRRAHELVPFDSVIAQNYDNLSAIIQQQEALQYQLRSALDQLHDENTYITKKLRTFLTNLRHEEDGLTVAIPDWKFGVLMESDPQEAQALSHHWLEKGYIRLTGERNAQLIPIYEINPYLEAELPRIQKQIPAKWAAGMEMLTIEQLEKTSYFSTLHKIQKMTGKYRELAERDLNELFLNYLMKNEKAVIILAGSLVETVLMHYCETNEILHFYQQRKNNKPVKRDLYESDLSEILGYLQEKKLLGDLVVHIGNIARLYRNFIHPGRELREPELLNQSKMDLCFLGTLEILNAALV